MKTKYELELEKLFVEYKKEHESLHATLEENKKKIKRLEEALNNNIKEKQQLLIDLPKFKIKINEEIENYKKKLKAIQFDLNNDLSKTQDDKKREAIHITQGDKLRDVNNSLESVLNKLDEDQALQEGVLIKLEKDAEYIGNELTVALKNQLVSIRNCKRNYANKNIRY